MGAKDSKPSFISYEEAVKKVSDNELRRIREAFKKCAGTNGTTLSVEAFVQEVLCEGVPSEVAEWLFQACGGTKRGISFKDLLCGLVVLTKGSNEEKIKLLWTLYVNNQNENGLYIYKWDFARTLHLENTSLLVTGAPRTNEILTGLFGSHGEKATFDQFRSWLLIHKDATVLSKWLLADCNTNNAHDSETPTFYQSLAGVTHLEERDIIELEKCFWSLRNVAPTGQLDVESLTPLLSPPLPRTAVRGVFLAFDENRDDHIDFKELCCGLSAACRGPRTERLKFCFKIFDLDRDAVLNKKELIEMVSILTHVANELLIYQNSRASTPSEGTDSDAHEKLYDPDVVLLNLREKLINSGKGGNQNKPVFQLGPTSIDASSDSTLENDQTDFERTGKDTKQISSDDSLTSIESEGVDIIGEDMALTQEDFLIWSVETAEALVTPFLDLIFEVCHVVLGLRPQCKHRERDIVQGWLNREVQRGYSVGQFWYLISAEWWANWSVYTASGATDSCCRQSPRPIDEAIVCDESFISNSTESMGSLLYRADTVSLTSAASSSGVSSGMSGNSGNNTRLAHHPGQIDNKRLLAPNPYKVRTLTGEGGYLRRDVTLAQHRDFELVPDALWRALSLWYGGPDPLPRQVVRPMNSDVELELYPLHLKLLRHIVNAQRMSTVPAVSGVSMYSSVPLAPAPPERQLAYTAAFSRLATVRQVCDFLCSALNLAREDMRLWALGAAAVLLDDDRPTLDELGFDERQRLLIEVRNADLTWPEEIGALSINASGWSSERRGTLMSPNLPGATGLHNLGNTCFMNAALQSVWNTGPLTRYFNSGMHLYEVNMTNPLGTKGALAIRYGELCKEVWSCSARSVAPLRVRWCVSRHAPQLSGGGQHDAQELLAWLLDALHEDLNRATLTPALQHNDSDGRSDQVVATEAWEHHTARNKSIMTDLFYGQLKSKVRCYTCGRESVRFDAFNMLSLPLPMESFVRCEIRVILLDGSIPVKYGVRVNSEGTYSDLKHRLSGLCGLSPESMLLGELIGATLGRTFEDGAKIKPSSAAELYAYEIPDATEDTDSGTDCELEFSAEDHDGWRGDAEPWPEVSRPCASNTSSLCMPALFCFKRSRSEIVMSQSPPNTFYSPHKKDAVTFSDSSPGDCKSNTLPKDLNELKKADKNGNRSPTLSVKSLNMKPASPRLGKIKFGSSPSNMNRMNECAKDKPVVLGKIQYLIAIHRKQTRADAYFLPSQRSRPTVFGVPLLVGLREHMSGRELYASVWTQVARLLSARPPHDQSNHATDCDDSLGYEFPFTLRVVNTSGTWCAVCPWPNFCRGCTLPSTDEPLVFNLRPNRGNTPRLKKRTSICKSVVLTDTMPDSNSPIAKAKLQRQSSNRITNEKQGEVIGNSELSRLDFSELRQLYWRPSRSQHTSVTATPLLLAIDWDPTALHLRYQSTREKACIEHESVRECMTEAARPVDLDHCLRAFTAEEKLEQRYDCAGCRSAQPATKKLQIWRLPPILIVHLKRFQYVNNKWIKSQKIVNFPFQDFDPTAYLASVPQETILRHQELKFMFKRRSSMFHEIDSHISESESSDDEDKPTSTQEATPSKCPESSNLKLRIERKRRESEDRCKVRERLESTSLVATPVTDDNLVDYHKHHLRRDQDVFDLKYRLYAVVSHSGQMSGGHYVAYARNPSGTWLCYNDSSCREITPVRRDGNSEPFPPIDPASAYLLFYERQGLDCEPYLPDITGREPVVRDSETLDGDDNDLRKMCVLS